AFDLATPMCGIYTIGGTDPDFTNFTDASIALNNAGITCPVIFEIRNGIYNEQIKLYEINGSSATNTITFRGESGDSSLVELHYQTSNPSNDFTLALTGCDYVLFEDMGVLRTNGTNSVLIQNESNNIRFESCQLGNVVSPATSVDKNLTFRSNNMEGYNLDLQHPDNSSAEEIIVENNFILNITVTNGNPVYIMGNHITDTSLYAQDFIISKSKNIEVSDNRFRRLILNSDTSINIFSNSIYYSGSSTGSLTGIFIESSCCANIYSNDITQINTINYWSGYSRGVEILNSSRVIILRNFISAFNRATSDRKGNNIGIYTRGASLFNIKIIENTIKNDALYGEQIGVYTTDGDSITVKKNTLEASNFDIIGKGIVCQNIVNFIVIDSNIVSNYQTNGLYADIYSSGFKVSNNQILNTLDLGILLTGSHGVVSNNTIDKVEAGDGINITANNATISENRFLNIQAGTGIIVNGTNNLVANNFIEADGVGIAKGISLQENGSGSQIVFNSINITGTDVANGIGLEVLGGDNYTVKNNIFANNGGGYASYFADTLNGIFDYNNYYSTKQKLGHFLDTDYTDFSSFQTAVGQETNGFAKNPFYTSDSLLQTNQILLNDAAEAGTGITTDIKTTIRGASPDLGAIEYTPCTQDAGINEFVGLINPLSVGNQNIQVELQNQGTNTLTSADIHWEVNGVMQTPFTWSGSLTYKANETVSIGSYTFAGGESYKLKAWIESPNGGADCNNYNDTAMAFDLATPMCGIYTIGGTDPDFTNFTDASIALNNAGITCPVIFEIRNG
ncbi:MAG TPA: right-handed parallel beta-helix repeat-containing protein, partial [Draconibacterium sp.]|nr:right-handed parallel beta-helix repeat-containing protein [Draconibacterium sp.]